MKGRLYIGITEKRTNNGIQNITQETKDWGAPEGLAVPAPHVIPVVLLLN